MTECGMKKLTTYDEIMVSIIDNADKLNKDKYLNKFGPMTINGKFIMDSPDRCELIKIIGIQNKSDKLPLLSFAAYCDEKFFKMIFHDIWPNLTHRHQQRVAAFAIYGDKTVNFLTILDVRNEIIDSKFCKICLGRNEDCDVAIRFILSQKMTRFNKRVCPLKRTHDEETCPSGQVCKKIKDSVCV